MRRISTLLLVAFLSVPLAEANPVSPASLIPETGPFGSFAVLFNPDDISGVVDGAAADYLRADGRRLGSLLAANTAPGYNVTSVTETFSEGDIGSRSVRVIAGSLFDVQTIQRHDGREVFAIGFTAFAEGSLIVIDGSAPYDSPDSGSLLHVVAWAESEDAAALLIVSSLELLSHVQPLGFVQEAPTESTPPTLSIHANPCVQLCMAEVELAKDVTVNLAVFDALGRRISMLASATLEAGIHRFAFEADGLPTGVYVARLIADGRLTAKRITLIR